LSNQDDDRSSGRTKNQDPILKRLSFSDIPSSWIKALAEFIGLEKTALWHSRLGEILFDAQYVDEPISDRYKDE
jgi:hypothetical protein